MLMYVLGWLEPLLDRIARDPTTVVCPVIDVIDDTTLEYNWRDSGGVNVGGFDWNLQVSFIHLVCSSIFGFFFSNFILFICSIIINEKLAIFLIVVLFYQLFADISKVKLFWSVNFFSHLFYN